MTAALPSGGKMATKAVHLNCLPVAARLAPQEAASWLREDLLCWLELVRLGYEAPDFETRDDFGMLVCDLKMMAEACVDGLVSGKEIRVKIEEPGSRDYEEHTKSMVHLLSAIEYDDGENAKAVLTDLAKALYARLKAEEEAHDAQEMREET
jgi:hypothetical protein